MYRVIASYHNIMISTPKKKKMIGKGDYQAKGYMQTLLHSPAL